jgi:hypothetical protein
MIIDWVNMSSRSPPPPVNSTNREHTYTISKLIQNNKTQKNVFRQGYLHECWMFYLELSSIRNPRPIQTMTVQETPAGGPRLRFCRHLTNMFLQGTMADDDEIEEDDRNKADGLVSDVCQTGDSNSTLRTCPLSVTHMQS